MARNDLAEFLGLLDSVDPKNRLIKIVDKWIDDGDERLEDKPSKVLTKSDRDWLMKNAAHTSREFVTSYGRVNIRKVFLSEKQWVGLDDRPGPSKLQAIATRLFLDYLYRVVAEAPTIDGVRRCEQPHCKRLFVASRRKQVFCSRDCQIRSANNKRMEPSNGD